MKPATITFNGQTRTLTEWSQVTGIPKGTVHTRHMRGYSPAEILTPLKPKPTKNEAVRYLDDLPVEQRPKKMVRLMAEFRGARFGEGFKRLFPEAFERWFTDEYVPAHHQ